MGRLRRDRRDCDSPTARFQINLTRYRSAAVAQTGGSGAVLLGGVDGERRVGVDGAVVAFDQAIAADLSAKVHFEPFHHAP